MKLPLFTADASLCTTRNVSSHRRVAHAAPDSGAVVPQLGGKNFKGFGGCISDCADQHPTWTLRRCERACRDPLSGVDLSTGSNGFNDYLTSAGIDFWQAGCSSLVNPWICRQVADVMRRQS